MDLAETIELEIRHLIKETEKAWQIKLDDGIWWLPKSQCRVMDNKVFIPIWLADSKGINYLDIDKT